MCEGVSYQTHAKVLYFKIISLYYLYANRLTYGVAKSTAAGSAISFLTLPLDDYYNHLGADFTIDKNILYCGAVFQREIRATREIYKKSL